MADFMAKQGVQRSSDFIAWFWTIHQSYGFFLW
jgi:hypothetical protein